MKEILITSSVLILVLLLLRVVFAKRVSRRLIYGAWLLVALRLLIPVQIGQVNFSLLTAAQPLTETVSGISQLRVMGQTERDVHKQIIAEYIESDQTVFTPEVQDRIQSDLEEAVPTEDIAVKIDKLYPQQQAFLPDIQQEVTQQVTKQAHFVSIGQVVTIIWLSGIALMAVWLVFVNLRHSYLLRKHRTKLDCHSPIPVYISEKVASPCLTGALRPVIYMTPPCAADPAMRHHVLTHELTHYRQGDHIWSWIRCLCLCIYWFDPLVWAAAWFSRWDCELACDEGALRQLGEEERIAYGKTLLEVVRQASAPENLIRTTTAMSETKKQLKERVNFIVTRRKRNLIAAICMVLSCGLVAGCVTTGPVVSKDKTDTLYVVESQKTYLNGELDSTATFRYDDHARPIGVDLTFASGAAFQTDLTYDQYGNRTLELTTAKYSPEGQVYTYRSHYDLTYTDGLLTYADFSYNDDPPQGITLDYDPEGRLTQITYSGYMTDESMGWQTFSYDDAGRLIQETYCPQTNQDGSNLLRNQYIYDQQGNLIETGLLYGESKKSVTPETVDTVQFKPQKEARYFLHYDGAGNLAYVGNENVKNYTGSSAAIYKNGYCAFDRHGNLLSIQKGPNRTEYTYRAVTVKKADAPMARRLMHNILARLGNSDRMILDPLSWEIAGASLYTSMLGSNPFYYLIPYPQLQLPHGKPVETESQVPMKTIYLLVQEKHKVTTDTSGQYSTPVYNIYDDQGRLLLRTESDTPHSIWIPELDAYGRVQRLHRTDGQASRVFTYDDRGNVLRIDHIYGGELYSWEVNTYDADGNLLVREMTYDNGIVYRDSYSYENGRLIQENAYTYEYDEQGRIRAKIRYVGSEAKDTYYYTYSEDGRTTYIEGPRSHKTIETVDEFGNLVRTESIGTHKSTVIEYIYIAIQVPADTPIKN